MDAIRRAALVAARRWRSAQRSCRASDLEAQVELLLERAMVLAAHRSRQSLYAAPAALLQGLTDRREADVGSDLEVVEAYDGEVGRDGEALEAGGLQHAEGLEVGGGEDRRRGPAQREQLTGQAVGREP